MVVVLVVGAVVGEDDHGAGGEGCRSCLTESKHSLVLGLGLLRL